jgi:hypothetical protein
LATRSIPSCSSTAFSPSDCEAVGNDVNSATDNKSARDRRTSKVQLTPEQELGASYSHLLCNVMLIIYFIIAQTNLVFTHLFILQTQCCLLVSWRSTLPCCRTAATVAVDLPPLYSPALVHLYLLAFVLLFVCACPQ